ncbi:MAG: hypothetical protein MUC58_07560 [Rhizobiaceae bacterium]|jgi:hypothetical protein|nr:hypothetical protein [Rhizobiaceae bacterium]
MGSVGGIAARILTELGPWSWLLAGLLVMALEMFWPKQVALAAGLSAIITGTMVLTLQFSWLAFNSVPLQLALCAMLFVPVALALLVSVSGK